jgi:DNA polymerase V
MQLFTLGDVARASLDPVFEALLYKVFGINAELIIDHAWGWEPVTVDIIKQYRPSTNSISSGQVLHCPYDFDKGRLIVREMTELLVLDLVRKRLVTKQIVLDIGYDRESLTGDRGKNYTGPVAMDHYGRKVPKHAHGTANLKEKTSSSRLLSEAVLSLHDSIVDRELLIRRINMSVNKVIHEGMFVKQEESQQLDFFTDFDEQQQLKEEQEKILEEEKQLQHAMLDIKKKFGKNALLKGTSLQEGATAQQRNRQIGGHKA